MNDETSALLFDVVERLERSIVARDCPAMVALEGERRLVLSDYDYLRDDVAAQSFEWKAAARAREIVAVRWVFAVPQVWVVTAERFAARAVSNHALREGEQEAITWMSFDRGNGVDYGRVPFARRPGGAPVFGEPEIFIIELRPAVSMPGYTLLQALMADGDGDPPEL
jgi:hypothetical protein